MNCLIDWTSGRFLITVSQLQTCNGKACLQGVCATINGTPKCLCYNGYSGENCQTGEFAMSSIVY